MAYCTIKKQICVIAIQQLGWFLRGFWSFRRMWDAKSSESGEKGAVQGGISILKRQGAWSFAKRIGWIDLDVWRSRPRFWPLRGFWFVGYYETQWDWVEWTSQIFLMVWLIKPLKPLRKGFTVRKINYWYRFSAVLCTSFIRLRRLSGAVTSIAAPSPKRKWTNSNVTITCKCNS